MARLPAVGISTALVLTFACSAEAHQNTLSQSKGSLDDLLNKAAQQSYEARSLHPTKIKWETEIAQAVKRALAEKKPLVVYFQRDKHVPQNDVPLQLVREIADCARLEKLVFPTVGFQSYSNRAVFIRQNDARLDAAGVPAKLIKELKVEIFPTLAVIDITTEKTSTRGQIKGYLKPEDYLTAFRTVMGYAGNDRPPAPKETTAPISMHLNDVPATARRGADEAVPGGKWQTAYKMRDEGWYKLVGHDADGHNVEFCADPQVKKSYLRTEIGREEVPGSVLAALKTKLPKFRPNKMQRCRLGTITVYRFEGAGLDRDDACIYVTATGQRVIETNKD